MITFKDILDNNFLWVIPNIINSLLLWVVLFILLKESFLIFLLINMIFVGIHLMFNFTYMKDRHSIDSILVLLNSIYYTIILTIVYIIYLIKYINEKRNENQIEEEEENYEE
jgi:NADH:ubiquinone oxidoreductase subunit 6 (subunit J)